MKMLEDLERFIDGYTSFDFSDPLGKLRIRKLIYEYDELRRSCDRVIRELKEIISKQTFAVTEMVNKCRELEAENKRLRDYIRESDAAKVSLREKKDIAEAEKIRMFDTITNLEDQLNAATEDNKNLRNSCKESMDEYEKLFRIFKKKYPDIEIDELIDKEAM